MEIEGASFNLPSVPVWHIARCPSYSSDKDETITIFMPNPLKVCYDLRIHFVNKPIVMVIMWNIYLMQIRQ